MRALGTALVALALPLTACSDGGGSSDSPEEPGTSTAQGSQPGGSAGRDVLEEAGLLDESGVVTVDEQPEDAAVQTAICDYVFGTGDEVAETAGLTGEITLADGSGWEELGRGQSGLNCFYEDADGIRLLLNVWSAKNELAGQDSAHVVQAEVDDGWASMAYHPNFSGEPLDDDRARTWLVSAADRVSSGS